MTHAGGPSAGPPDCVASLLTEARERLADIDGDAALDAELLLALALCAPRSYLYAHPEHRPPAATLQRFRSLLSRRAGGEPLAYLTGRREFWSLDLEVTPDTLIPRPETELLVEQALTLLDANSPVRAVDLGTGCGAIAIALASERPAWRITAVEQSPAALTVARRNARLLGLERVRLLAGRWFEPLGAETFDLVVSNPPYVAAGDPCLAALRHEPHEALAAGPDGLDALRALVADAPQHLRPGGRLLVEHGAEQGPAVRDLFAAAGLREITTHRDLGGLERACSGRHGGR